MAYNRTVVRQQGLGFTKLDFKTATPTRDL